MKHAYCSKGSWIDGNNVVLNRSWTYDGYFSLHRPIHWWRNVREKCSAWMSGYHILLHLS